MKLVDLEITKDEYDKLPLIHHYTNKGIKAKPIGWKCKDNKGTVRELVKGMDMFAFQWGAGLHVPALGWRHYRPVFTNEEVT